MVGRLLGLGVKDRKKGEEPLPRQMGKGQRWIGHAGVREPY